MSTGLGEMLLNLVSDLNCSMIVFAFSIEIEMSWMTSSAYLSFGSVTSTSSWRFVSIANSGFPSLCAAVNATSF